MIQCPAYWRFFDYAPFRLGTDVDIDNDVKATVISAVSDIREKIT